MPPANHPKPATSKRRPWLWLLLMAGLYFAALSVISSWQGPNAPAILNYSAFLAQIDRNAVRSVTIEGHVVHGEFTDNKNFEVTIPETGPVIERLLQHHVDVGIIDSNGGSAWIAILLMASPVLLLLLLFGVFARRVFPDRGVAGGIFGFGKSRARLYAPEERKVTLADVAGIDEA